MNYIHSKKNYNKELLDKYLMIFNDGKKFNEILFKKYNSYKNNIICLKNNKIIAAAFYKEYKIINKDATKNIIFIYGVFTIPEYRKQGISKNVLKKLVSNFPNKSYEIWLQPISEEYYKWLNIKPIIERKICANKPTYQSKVIQKYKPITVTAKKMLAIYEKYHLNNMEINSKYSYVKRDLEYFKNMICFYKANCIDILLTEKSYIIYDKQIKYVFEIMTLDINDASEIINYYQEYWFWLINQKNLEHLFSTRIVKNLIYSINTNDKYKNMYFSDNVLLD